MSDFVDEFALGGTNGGLGRERWGFAWVFLGGVGVIEGQPPVADLDDCTGL